VGSAESKLEFAGTFYAFVIIKKGGNWQSLEVAKSRIAGR